MTIDRHVFGSFKGYTTLAKSAGVSPDDCRVVERCVYGFGQTYDNRFYKTLSKSPGWFVLQFSGNRRGLTRIGEGALDDQGRPTLLFTSILLAKRDWDGVVLGDIAALLGEKSLWVWDGTSTVGAVEVAEIGARPEIPAKRVGRVLQMISQLENAVRNRSRLVLSENDVTAEDFRALEMLLPPAARPTVTLCWRGLSAQAPTTLVGLARDVDCAAASPFSEGGVLSPYAVMLQQAGIESGVIPLTQVMQYRSFGAAITASAESGVGRPSSQVVTCIETRYRTRKRWVAVAALIGLLLGLPGGAGAMYLYGANRMAAEVATAKSATTRETDRVDGEKQKAVAAIQLKAVNEIAEAKEAEEKAIAAAKEAEEKAAKSDAEAAEAKKEREKVDKQLADLLAKPPERQAPTRPADSMTVDALKSGIGVSTAAPEDKKGKSKSEKP